MPSMAKVVAHPVEAMGLGAKHSARGCLCAVVGGVECVSEGVSLCACMYACVYERAHESVQACPCVCMHECL